MAVINEIYRLPARWYRGSEVIDPPIGSDQLTNYPGSEFQYHIDQAAPMATVRMFKNHQRVGLLSLKHQPVMSLSYYRVGTISVVPAQRGQGVARALYWIAMSQIGNLMAGESHTPGGRKNWARLVRLPGCLVQGLAMVPLSQVDHLLAQGCRILDQDQARAAVTFPVVAGATELKSQVPELQIYEGSPRFGNHHDVIAGLR